MLKFGCTRVELGVQSIYNDVLELNRRGHKAKETIKGLNYSIKQLRDGKENK